MMTAEARATAAGRSTAGELVYAVGDIHGCYGLMKQALAKIAQDALAQARGRRPRLIFLGDYVDRGPDSAKVLQALVWLQRRGEFDLTLLKGNHEQALLHFLEAPEDGAAWLEYGGAETLAAYGVSPPAEPDASAMSRARDALLDHLPASHLHLLNELELQAEAGDYAFVHAGVRPGVPMAAQTETDLLWIRRGFVDASGPFDRVIVHGHTWRDEDPQVGDHRIGIDTGAYATGVLTTVRLDGAGLHLFQARDRASYPDNSRPSPALLEDAGTRGSSVAG